jgi:hypothetical protein
MTMLIVTEIAMKMSSARKQTVTEIAMKMSRAIEMSSASKQTKYRSYSIAKSYPIAELHHGHVACARHYALVVLVLHGEFPASLESALRHPCL